MNFKINLTDDDFIAFNTYYIFQSRAGKRSILIGRCSILIAAILVLIVSFVMKGGSRVVLIEGIILLVLAVIWFVLYPNLIKRNIAKRVRKLRREGNLPYESEVELSFSDTGITEKTETTCRETPYTDFREVTEAGQYIYLAKHTAESMIIPVRCLEDPHGFLAYIHERIGS